MARKDRQTVTMEVMDAGRVLSTAAIMFHTVVAEKQGLGVSEEKAIEMLQRFGGLTAGELSAKTGLAPASVTGLLNRLEKKGFVRRVSDEGDGRKVRVELVFERLAEFAPLFQGFMQSFAELCNDYTVAELDVIARFMRDSARIQSDAAIKLGT